MILVAKSVKTWTADLVFRVRFPAEKKAFFNRKQIEMKTGSLDIEPVDTQKFIVHLHKEI